MALLVFPAGTARTHFVATDFGDVMAGNDHRGLSDLEVQWGLIKVCNVISATERRISERNPRLPLMVCYAEVSSHDDIHPDYCTKRSIVSGVFRNNDASDCHLIWEVEVNDMCIVLALTAAVLNHSFTRWH